MAIRERGIDVPSFSPSTSLATRYHTPALEMANVIIHGGTFNSAQGDFHISNKDSGLHILRLGVSLGAIHNSAERYPPPNCHPDTRRAVRQIILDWIHSKSSASSFFWLYGPAGAGKTAILQAIAEFLCHPSESGQNFVASFFFSRGKKGHDQGHFLFSTIAYQLALKVPGLRQHVDRIMESDPTLHTKSMDIQLQKLIVDAFHCLSTLPQRSYLVIIDGLDECHDKATQQMILRLLCETITVHKSPLRFLIGSRPESHIRDSFDQESLYTITRRVILDETFDPGRDIQVFLKDGFAKICAKNSILSYVEHPWPEEGIIDLLVQRSSGQFIYAATVLKFVGADFCSPTKRLALVLKRDSTAFSDLDRLYTQIISVYPTGVNIVEVLGIISVSHGEFSEVMEDIFGMEEGELKLVLSGLSCLMKDEKGESLNMWTGAISHVIPHFAHASFGDYLFNSSRSGPFHVNRQEYENQVTIRSFALIIQSIRMSSITRVHPTTWYYFIQSSSYESHLSDRFIRSPREVKKKIMTDLNDLVQEFWTSSDRAVEASVFAMLRLLEILKGCFDLLEKLTNPNSWQYCAQSPDDQFNPKILFDCRKMIDQSFSKSKDLGDMLRFLPGVVVQKRLSEQGMADLYRIKPDYLKRLIKSTIMIEPLIATKSGYLLDDYLSCFLQDRDRSQLYYCDPKLQHISICRHFLSLLDRSNVFDLQSHDLIKYVRDHFYDHLSATTTDFRYIWNVSDPVVEILHDLEITAYYVDESLSGRLAQCIIEAILRWTDVLKESLNCWLKYVSLRRSVSYVDLMERVCHLRNKIYREILCITRDERTSYITIGGLDHIQVSTFSWTPQYSIVLSWELLDWILGQGMGGIHCSFANFITTPELSGPFYISTDIYSTQITEYSLETIFREIYLQPSPFYLYQCYIRSDWAFRRHISRALPTEMIFYLLRSIRSEILLDKQSRELKHDTLNIIVKWLEGLGSEQPSDLYNRFQGELLCHKGSLDQSLIDQFLLMDQGHPTKFTLNFDFGPGV